MHLLAFLTDAFGGRGGIAAVNRDLCRTLCAPPLSAEMTVLPRLQPDPPGDLPSGLDYRTEAAGGKGRYLWHAGRTLREPAPDLVLCGHVNLLPVAYPVARIHGAPLLLLVHGIEAWGPQDVLTRQLASRVDVLAAVSRHTLHRFQEHVQIPDGRCAVLPNAVDQSGFGPGPKPPALLDRYDLEEHTVLLTLSRLVPGRPKGHDRVLEVLPRLEKEIPDVAYLICGEGDDRPRLEQKAHELDVEERVVFAGYVPEEEKAAHYRLADAFVMPGYGEGFGLVYIEALASGIPVVASTADASQEVLQNIDRGTVVDPDDLDDVRRGIVTALGHERGTVPDGLARYSQNHFRRRWQSAIEKAVSADSMSEPPPSKTDG